MFENVEVLDTKSDIASYLAINTTTPLTKNELMDFIGLQALKQVDLSKLFKVKVAGKDRDPMFWSFGKIHGLENIAYVDPEEVKATDGNPVKIQQLVNKVEGRNI